MNIYDEEGRALARLVGAIGVSNVLELLSVFCAVESSRMLQEPSDKYLSDKWLSDKKTIDHCARVVRNRWITVPAKKG